jgi:hypothetical protein
MILTVNGDYFLNSIHQLIFITVKSCFLCGADWILKYYLDKLRLQRAEWGCLWHCVFILYNMKVSGTAAAVPSRPVAQRVLEIALIWRISMKLCVAFWCHGFEFRSEQVSVVLHGSEVSIEWLVFLLWSSTFPVRPRPAHRPSWPWGYMLWRRPASKMLRQCLKRGHGRLLTILCSTLLHSMLYRLKCWKSIIT